MTAGGSPRTLAVPLPELSAVAPELLARLASRTVLLVEDDPLLMRISRRALEMMGARIVEAADGQVALDRWRAERVDLVLLDVMMPVLDGLSAARTMRAEESQGARARTPIVALSANAEPHERAACLEAGCDAFVPKPLVLERLRAALDAIGI